METNMQLNLGKEIAAMEQMAMGQLRDLYAEVFGETTNARNKQWLLKEIIWRIQSIAEGDLSERARVRAMEIASDADIRRRPPKAPATKPEAPRSTPIPVPVSLDNGIPIPGSLITLEYKGRLLDVLVLDEGFEYAGEKFKSLSAVAKRITGSHCNGYLFFHLRRPGDR
jgi:hypothetical protein